jgi:hypothetical protein
MNQAKQGVDSIKKGNKKAGKYIDDSVLELVEVEAKAAADEVERKKKEEDKRKKAERKAKKKENKLTRSERKKRRAERPVVDTNLPENRRIVRDAIKMGRLGTVKEDLIDPLEITDRLDMMSHRSDILIRSAERLLDQVMVLAEESMRVDVEGEDDDDQVIEAAKKKTQTVPYGKTGEIFGLRGVKEPVVKEGESITDLEDGDGEHYVMKVPKENAAIKEIEEPKDGVTMGDIGDMYKQLGYDEEVASKAVAAEEERIDIRNAEEERAIKKKMRQKEGKG